ncbi:MAG: hypothetical protein M0Z60_04510 [Nitrospiraceae bacterium]|nr:hypothetical protein [Nitrospiraceae bacterium]
MDLTTKVAIIIGIFLLTLALNLFFGRLRIKTRKFSLKWFLCIHLPIPFIFLARISAHVSAWFIPLFVVAALAGQILGGRIEI